MIDALLRDYIKKAVQDVYTCVRERVCVCVCVYVDRPSVLQWITQVKYGLIYKSISNKNTVLLSDKWILHINNITLV